MVAQAGQVDGELDLDRCPTWTRRAASSGHRRSVGGTLVLPAEGAVVDLVRRNRRVGPCDRPGRTAPSCAPPAWPSRPPPTPWPTPAEGVRSDHGGNPEAGTRPDFKPDWEPFSLPEDEVLRRGGALFDDGMYWEAHEVWEEVWRMRKDRPDRDFLKGIIQGAAGMWHATQGNYKGAVSVLSRAVEYLEPYRPAKDGIDVERCRRPSPPPPPARPPSTAAPGPGCA